AVVFIPERSEKRNDFTCLFLMAKYKIHITGISHRTQALAQCIEPDKHCVKILPASIMVALFF
ncbi:MAG TPA: hypothetical protein PKD14_11490, partial [Saprospiraceae bacterium]|nr:hypothetical protein [Saprospiraceae bacterium]